MTHLFELESCSNPLRIQQVFDCKLKKFFHLGLSVGDIMGHIFTTFWPTWPGPGRQPKETFFGSSFY